MCSICIYLILFIVLIVNSVKERQFTTRNVGTGNSLTRVMTVSNCIFATSFVFRIIVDIVDLSDKASLVTLQCKSCLYVTPGYGIYIFSLHFFGVLLPLSALFTLQLVTIIKSKKPRKSLASFSRSPSSHQHLSLPEPDRFSDNVDSEKGDHTKTVHSPCMSTLSNLLMAKEETENSLTRLDHYQLMEGHPTE